MLGSLRKLRWWRSFCLLLLALGCLQCGPVTPLLDEHWVSPYRELGYIDQHLSETEYMLPAGVPGAPDLGVHVREIGASRVGAPVIVLLNGVFSDGRTWRFITGTLAQSHHVLVMDLPGTGKSSAPDPDGLPGAYTPSWVAQVTLQALSSWQARQPVARDFVLVGHSIGGTVALRMLGDPELRRSQSELVARLRGAVLIAPADISIATWSPTLVELAQLSGVEIELGDAFGILEDRVERAIARSVVTPERAALRAEAARILENLKDPSRRRASQAMLLRIRPLDADRRPVWSEVSRLAAYDAAIEVPVLLLWGREDDALPVDTGRVLAARIPGSRLQVVENVRHSVHQEAPLETEDAIEMFVSALR